MKAIRIGFITLLGFIVLLQILNQDQVDWIDFTYENHPNGRQDEDIPHLIILSQSLSESGQDDDRIRYLAYNQVIPGGEVQLILQVPESFNSAKRVAKVQMQFREVGVSEIKISVLSDNNQLSYTPLYNRHLDGLGWSVIQNGNVSLYQRVNPPPPTTYGNIQEFLDQLGSGKVPGTVAVYGYPASHFLLPLEQALSLDAVGIDYIIAHYTPTEHAGDIYFARQTLDIPEGSTANGFLRFVLTIAGHRGHTSKLELDSLQVDLEYK